jgi:hypothetical protein
MLVFRHPKYYKELRKRNKLAESRQPVVGGQQQSDQAISLRTRDGECERAPDPGQTKKATSSKLQASSNKHKSQATSSKQQANEG